MYRKVITATLMASALIGFTGCDSITPLLEKAKNGEFVIKPSPLELHGSTVTADLSAQLPDKVLKPKMMYELEVYYQTPTSEPMQLGKMTFDGDAPPANRTIANNFGFTYEDKYKEGNLAFKGKAYKKAKPDKFKETDIAPAPLNRGKGVITTSRLVMAPYAVNYLPHEYDNSEEYIPTEIAFFFQQGRSELRYSERRSDRGKEMENYISAKAPTRTVNVTGMHSPEGSERVNSKLSNDRAKVVEDFYKSLAKKYDYKKEIDNINFALRPIVNDWTAFKAAVEDYSKLTDAQKSEIMDVINGPGDFVSKEIKLQSLSSYRTLMREIYPGLRTSKAEILQIKDKPSDAELMVMSQKAGNGEEVDGLNAKQIQYAAAMTPSLEEKEKMYQAAIKLSDNYVAYNNLGATYMAMALEERAKDKKMALVDKAITNFELSLKKQKSTETYVNLTSAQLLKGDADAAKATMSNVSGSASGTLASSISALKAYMAITNAEYDMAIAELEKSGNDYVVLYNKALAHLLKESKAMSAPEAYGKVMTAFEEATSANDGNALAFYGAAITAARMNNADKMVSNLKKAISLDSSLRDRAVKDLEFFGKENLVADATR
jgi:tetratricopeptide (TPR) repeat protein